MKITFIKKNFNIEDNYVICTLYCHCSIGNFFVAEKARCNKGDKFDANIGMKIALARAEMKAYKVANKEIKIKYERFKKKTDELKEFIDKANHCIKHNKEYIKKISE